MCSRSSPRCKYISVTKGSQLVKIKWHREKIGWIWILFVMVQWNIGCNFDLILFVPTNPFKHKHTHTHFSSDSSRPNLKWCFVYVCAQNKSLICWCSNSQTIPWPTRKESIHPQPFSKHSNSLKWIASLILPMAQFSILHSTSMRFRRQNVQGIWCESKLHFDYIIQHLKLETICSLNRE